MGGTYQATYARASEDPDGFWAEAAEALEWERRWDRVLDDSRPPFYRWFTGGRLNTCHNAVDRHVARGRGEQIAVIHDSPVTDTVRTLTFKELQREVARFAGMLRQQGVGQGDRVIIYLPMVPEALIAMLGCARIGAVHSVVFGGFASHELAARIDDAKPKLLISASCGIEAGRVIPYKPLLDGAIEQAAHKPERCVILARPQSNAELISGRDLDWGEAIAGAQPTDCVPVAATGTQSAGCAPASALPQSRSRPGISSARACGRARITQRSGLCAACSIAPSSSGLYGITRPASMPQDAEISSLG
ncbi:MAG TPA: AMP-binding protein, partial [Geminicoccaceae bacterium]|nr:AMP-binding protein [Geminicoccaceae bacterium]